MTNYNIRVPNLYIQRIKSR